MTNDPMRRICFWISIALTLLTRAGLVAARPPAAPGTLLWQQNLNGTAGNSFGEGLSVAVDNQGNVVAAGITQKSGGTFFDFTVAKFGR